MTFLAVAAAVASSLVWRGPTVRRRLVRRFPGRQRTGLLATSGSLARRRSGSASRVTTAELAVALDVLAGCLGAGVAMPSALGAAAAAAPPGVAASLRLAAAALGRGDDPVRTWARLAEAAADLDPVARLCSRAAVTGAAVADEVHRTADALRSAADTTRRRRLQRASVWLVLPLGLCFLPAFVLVGVVPLVAGLVPGLLR